MYLIKIFGCTVVAATLVFACGCSSHVSYKNDLEKNLTINTEAESGSSLVNLETWVEIYTLDQACNTSYQGSFDLKKPKELVGLPSAESNYLYFVFWSKKAFTGTTSKVGVGAHVNTRPGYQYLADVSYVDGFYDVTMKEQKNGSKKYSELQYGKCKPF